MDFNTSYVALASYIGLEDQAEQKTVRNLLSSFIGKTVCVAWVKDKESLRNNFEPQISVQGELEGNADTGKFRVLLNDDTYAYFYDDSVWVIGYDGANLVTDKKRPVIFIN